MRRLILKAAFAVLAATMSLQGASAQEALEQELSALFQRYNDLIGEDKIQEALALRTAESKAEIEAELAKGSAEDQAGMKNMLKGLTPETFVSEHLETDGADQASLYGVGSKVMPVGPDAGKLKRIEMQVEFAREDGAWRIGTPTFLGDPDAVKTISDVAYEPVGAYDVDRSVNIGGRVVRVALEPDHTLIVIRMLDEEQALFLPDQAFLKEQGFDVGLLKPYAMVEADGYPHKTDGQKVWVTGLSVR